MVEKAESAGLTNLGIAVNEAAALDATQISTSYGGSELFSSSYEGYYDHSGLDITVSSGDSGYGVQFPASSPHVTAVGGTRLVQNSTAARGWSETVWSGAGSGCSSTYAKPSWQNDSGCARRTVADVSAVADPNTGVGGFDSTPLCGGAGGGGLWGA